MRKLPRTILFHYGGALVFTTLALLFRWLVDPVVGESLPLETLYGAVAFAQWLGGYRPALLATAFGYVACNVLFLSPRGTFSPLDSVGLIRLVLYLFSCTVIIVFGEAMRAARRRAESGQRDVLDKSVLLEREVQSRRHSEERFVRFMQHLPGLAWIKDLYGRYVYANDAAVKVFGCTREGLYGKTDEEIFPLETAALFKANDRRVLANDSGIQIIETLKHPDGIVHYSLVSKFPIVGADGKPALIGGMAIDVSDRLRAEEVLAESEQRFRQLAENINEVFWIADPQNQKVLYVSPAYERVWGRSCQSLYEHPRSFLDAVHPEDRRRVDAKMGKQGEGEPTDVEYRVVRPDDSTRWVRDRAFPVKNAAGQCYRMVGIAEDITEKKRAEEALKEADRRKDQFLAMLAHELRNPLAPLRNIVEVLRCAQGKPALMEQAHGMIERQIRHMVRLIDDLLDVSRITRGRLQLRRERVELAAVIRTAVETSRPLFEAASHDFTMVLPVEPVYLDADPIRLAQVLSNLLNNAAKYTEKGGRIQLSVERQGDEAVISVRDNGIGIAPEDMSHLFEMFSQVAPATERSQGGLGIGLSLVKGLVELHGGSVRACSDGAGQGTEFIVRLPMAASFSDSIFEEERGKAAEPDDSEKPRSRPKRRILVVDDNRDSAESLAMMLRLMGHKVELAHDGLEAVRTAESIQPDVVLLDIGLPHMNGYEAASYIREQQWGKDMLLIALTGWGSEEDKRRARQAGFDHHLTKPVGIDDLDKVIECFSRVCIG